MATSRSPEAKLAELEALRKDPHAVEARPVLRRALAAAVGLVVAKAAQIAGEARLVDLHDDLQTAFGRLLAASYRADPGCRAKTAIVEALLEIGEERPSPEMAGRVLLPGAVLVQWEPVRGGKVDTAGPLRSACAAGLVRENHPVALTVLTDQLADPLLEVREVAARILGWRGGADAVLLLRLRVGIGDDARVILECLRALLTLDSETALALATKRLEAVDGDTFQAAALVLGESRTDTALRALTDAWERQVEAEPREVLAMALVLLRREEATTFLLARVREDPPRTASAVLEALATGRGDETLRRRVGEAVSGRTEPEVRHAFDRAFG